MKITGQKVVVKQGYPELIVQTDLGEARIGLEQKLAGRGLLFIEGSLSDKLADIELPADPANGQAALTLRSFTADEELLRLYREFAAQQE